MLKRAITYHNFDGEKVTKDYYFNIGKAELIEMELSEVDGLKAAIQKIIKAGDMKSLVNEFKKIILASYGQKSEDGERFIKSPELSLQFSQTAAFDSLFMDLATNETAAAIFIKGVLPADMVAQLDVAATQDKPTSVPEAFKLPKPPQPPMPPTSV